MSRQIIADRTELFRAVIETPWGLRCFGPYARKQDAKGALKREGRYGRLSQYPQRIERTELNWEVDE